MHRHLRSAAAGSAVKHVTVPIKALLCLFVACVLLGGLTGPAQAAKGGNSANAKLCQKGGWQKLYSTTGDFASEEECVSYAARGGTLSSTPPTRYLVAYAQCSEVGGTWSEPVRESIYGVVYQCSGTSRYLTLDEVTAVFDECVSLRPPTTFVALWDSGPESGYYCKYF